MLQTEDKLLIAKNSKPIRICQKKCTTFSVQKDYCDVFSNSNGTTFNTWKDYCGNWVCSFEVL